MGGGEDQGEQAQMLLPQHTPVPPGSGGKRSPCIKLKGQKAEQAQGEVGCSGAELEVQLAVLPLPRICLGPGDASCTTGDGRTGPSLALESRRLDTGSHLFGY